jgi:hypothetical protein
MKRQTRRQRFQQHVERLRELGKQDAARRCSFCRRPLPATGVFMVYGRPEHYCGVACFEDGEEASLLRQRTVQ